MNYIENDDMELFASTLTDLEVGNYVYNGKVEAFSSIAMDAKEDLLFNDKSNKSYLEIGLKSIGGLNSASVHQTPLSASIFNLPAGRQRSSSLTGYHPPRKVQRRRASSLGDLSEPSTQALLCKLIYALNDSFPDYDFGNVRLHQFTTQDVPTAMKVVNNHLTEVLSQVNSQLLGRLWKAIDSMVNLNRCEVFLYTPDIYADEDSSAFRDVWCFHYFFFNKDLKQLCYLTCSATSKLRSKDSEFLYAIDEDDETDYDRSPVSSGARSGSFKRRHAHGGVSAMTVSDDNDDSENDEENDEDEEDEEEEDGDTRIRKSVAAGLMVVGGGSSAAGVASVSTAVVENGTEEGNSEDEEDVPDWDGII